MRYVVDGLVGLDELDSGEFFDFALGKLLVLLRTERFLVD